MTPRRLWTREEIEIVSQMWRDDLSAADIAASLNGSRSEDSIKLKMANLGAKRPIANDHRSEFCKRLGANGVNEIPGYSNWVSMRRRCRNPGPQNIEGYRDRNITVCERWDALFEAFYEDMGPRPHPTFSIERTDNDKGYSPENCIWASPKTQQNNTRRNRYVEFRGARMSVTMAYAVSGCTVKYDTYRQRISAGWDIDSALFTPTNFNLSRTSK